MVCQITTDSSGNIIASYEYTIGANGERIRCVESSRVVEYEYDELERIVSETIIIGEDILETHYAYDANSNRISMERDGDITTYEYNELNQIVRAGDVDYTWDNAGNLVSQSSMGTILATYEYDCLNRMIGANINSPAGIIIETYTYDYRGIRTSKTTNGETYLYVTDLSSGYSQLLKTINEDETIYYTRGFELISRRENLVATYYVYDGTMSVRSLVDEDGIIIDTLVYDAFGNELERTGNTNDSYGFQSEERDATGLYYLRTRYMSPETGTFTTMDSYPGAITNPISMHKYIFANSNPVKYYDPSGMFSLIEFELAESIDEILMSSMNYAIGYIGIVANNNRITDADKLAGYFAAVGIGLIMPFVFSTIALLPFLTSLLVMTLVVETLTLATLEQNANGNYVGAALLGMTAGDFVGHAFARVFQEATHWIMRPRLISVSATGGEVYTQDWQGRWHNSRGHYVSFGSRTGTHYLHRPYLRRDTIYAIYNNTTVNYETGDIWDDVLGRYIPQENVEIGHRPGFDFRLMREYAESIGMSQAQFNDLMNDPSFYFLQDISANRSHVYESDILLYNPK